MKIFKPSFVTSSTLFIVIMALFLSGCGNRYEEQLQKSYNVTKNDLTYLKSELDTKQLTNALLINKYAYALSEQKPDFNDVVMLLKKESTSDGKAYKSLQKRLNAVNLLPTNQDQANANLNELRLISAAAEPSEYNNMLADVVNTIASLSDGKLPVVNVPLAQQKTAQQTNALIGNPSYGNWNKGSDGRSFWEWYGMYSMFSNVMGGGRSYYGGWSSRPNYSYYNNYGRNRWGSSNDVTRNYNLSKKNPSRYNKPSAATKQRYAKASSRSSSFGSSKNRSSVFGSKSNSSSKSRSSSYGSSSRSSSFSSSRSSFSGK